jgi:hypothetical protein
MIIDTIPNTFYEYIHDILSLEHEVQLEGFVFYAEMENNINIRYEVPDMTEQAVRRKLDKACRKAQQMLPENEKSYLQ